MLENNKKLILVILTGIAFGSSIVFARFALREIGPFSVTVLRFGIASLAFLITFVALKKKPPTDRKVLRDIMVVGILASGLPLLLFYFALTYISSGIFTIFLSSLPLLTAVFAHIFLKGEKLHKNLVVGLLLAFLGVIFLIATKSSGLAGGKFSLIGPVVTFCGVLSWAVGSVYAKAHVDKEDVLVVSTGQTLAAFIFILVIVLGLGKFHMGSVSPIGWFSVFYNGLIGSYVAFWLVFTLIKKYGPTASGLPNYVMPVVSTLMGALLLGELITWPLLLGALVILLGVFFASKGVKQKK